jgi:hypothetical protein
MIWAYRQEEPEQDSDAWLEEILSSKQSEQEQEEQNLYCFVCGQIITQAHQRIPVEGAHKHTFTNPGGYVFEIGCFRDAPGCEQAGEFTDFYSWFDGYRWRYAMCRGCRVHLGWVFESSETGTEQQAGSFFGLVLNRLLSSKEIFPSES